MEHVQGDLTMAGNETAGAASISFYTLCATVAP
jgi:hypothetical protein